MRKRRYAGAASAVGSLVLLLPVLAQAAPTPAQRCQAAKLLAAGSEARAHLTCTRSSDPFACLARAAERRDRAFLRAEARGGCVTTGDSADVGAEVDALLADLLDVLRPGGFGKTKCTNAQLTASAAAITRLAQAYARNERKPDPARLAKDLAAAEEKFDKAFARAVAKGDCLSQATAAEAYAVIAQAGARLLGKLSPSCGDGILASSEACDGSETGTCAGDCLPDCTCAGACGDGIVQAGEACDGSGCVAEDPNGCFPPGWSNECQCCASASPCYVRGFGNPTPVELPCCTGVCEIPGPEAGPDVIVHCTEPPATPCPCWTSALLDSMFPPGFFDEAGRGGAQCDVEPTVASVSAVDTCTFVRLSGVELVVQRGGAGVIEDTVCVVFPDLDPDDNGQCFAPPENVHTITPEQSVACIAALVASQVYQSACP